MVGGIPGGHSSEQGKEGVWGHGSGRVPDSHLCSASLVQYATPGCAEVRQP